MYTYNSRGCVTQTTDALGKNWTKAYDFAGNVTSETDPLRGLFLFAFSARG